MSVQIGDLRFFRGAEYQALFRELDAAGGFYTERVLSFSLFEPDERSSPSRSGAMRRSGLSLSACSLISTKSTSPSPFSFPDLANRRTQLRGLRV